MLVFDGCGAVFEIFVPGLLDVFFKEELDGGAVLALEIHVGAAADGVRRKFRGSDENVVIDGLVGGRLEMCESRAFFEVCRVAYFFLHLSS